MSSTIKKPDAARGGLEHTSATPAPEGTRLKVVGREKRAEPSAVHAGWEPVPEYVRLLIHPDQTNEGISFFRGERLDTVCGGISRSLSMPRSVIDTAVVTAAAAALGLNVSVQASPSMIEKPIIWTILMCPPGARKSAACSLVTAPLVTLEGQEVASWQEKVAALSDEQKAIERSWSDFNRRVTQALKAGSGAPVAPSRRPADICIPGRPRLISQDATPAAILEAAEDSGRGLLLAPDEAIALFAKAPMGSPMRSLLLKGFTGSPMTVDRAVSKHARDIAAFGFSLLTTTQPEVVRRLPLGHDDGLFARVLWACSAQVPEFSLSGEAIALDDLSDILRTLRAMGANKVIIPLDRRAIALLEEAGRRWTTVAVGLGGIAQSWFIRAPVHALRLALVLASIEVASRGDERPPATVNQTAMLKAIRLIDQVFIPNMWVALAAFGQSEALSTAEGLIRYLHRERLTTFNRRDLHRTRKGLFGSPQAFANAVDHLIRDGVLRPADPAPGQRGRPRLDVEVNPHLLVL